MDRIPTTVTIKEYRNGVMTERSVTYMYHIESVARFNEIHERRNRIEAKRMAEASELASIKKQVDELNLIIMSAISTTSR